MKTYHIPDWDRAVKGSGTTLTDFAVCGENVTKTGQWFGMYLSVVNCDECLTIWNKGT